MSHPIVIAARAWIDTRFSHQGRRKKSAYDAGGVDCLGLLIGVAQELNLKDRVGRAFANSDTTDYSKVPDGNRLQATLGRLLESIAIEQMRAGDIVLFRLDGNPQHLGIISDHAHGFGIIHAYAPSRKVVENRLDESWEEKIVSVFRIS